MIRALVIGVLASAATVTGEVGAPGHGSVEQRSPGPKRTTEARRTHETQRPAHQGRRVQGYAVMLLGYTVDVDALRSARDGARFDPRRRGVPLCLDDATIDFDHLDRFDFAKMSKSLIHAVNARVKADVLVDVGVEEFTYAAIGDTRARPGTPAAE